MDDKTLRSLHSMLEHHEAKRALPYDDATGKTVRKGDVVKGNITIGIGRNLNAKGLSEQEIAFLLANDIKDAESDAIFLLGESVYRALTPARQIVVVSMAFNMGRERLGTFVNTLRCIRTGDYLQASKNMLASLWAQQVGARAVHLAEMMKKGQ